MKEIGTMKRTEAESEIMAEIEKETFEESGMMKDTEFKIGSIDMKKMDYLKWIKNVMTAKKPDMKMKGGITKVNDMKGKGKEPDMKLNGVMIGKDKGTLIETSPGKGFDTEKGMLIEKEKDLVMTGRGKLAEMEMEKGIDQENMIEKGKVIETVKDYMIEKEDNTKKERETMIDIRKEVGVRSIQRIPKDTREGILIWTDIRGQTRTMTWNRKKECVMSR